MVNQSSGRRSILRIRPALRRGLGLRRRLAISLTLRRLFLVCTVIRLLLCLTISRLACLLMLPLLLRRRKLGLAHFLGLRLGRSQLLIILLRRRLARRRLGVLVSHRRLLVIRIRRRRRLLIIRISRRRRLLRILLGRHRLRRRLLRINNTRLLRIIRLGVGHARPLRIRLLRFGGLLRLFLLLQLRLASPLTFSLKPLGLGSLRLFSLANLLFLLSLDLRVTRLLRLLTLTTRLRSLLLLSRSTLLRLDLGLASLLTLLFQTLRRGNLRLAMRCNRLLMFALEHGGLIDNQLALGPQALRLGRIRHHLLGNRLHLLARHLFHLLDGKALVHNHLVLDVNVRDVGGLV